MEKAHAQYQDLLKESHAAALPTTLKVTSSTDGFRVMDPFDWTLDKNVYQRWQLWSHKARLALEAMEGDTEKTKISYLHHWLNGEGTSKIEGWKNSKILISQEEYDKLTNKTGKYSLDKIESYFSLCELALTPRSNPCKCFGHRLHLLCCFSVLLCEHLSDRLGLLCCLPVLFCEHFSDGLGLLGYCLGDGLS